VRETKSQLAAEIGQAKTDLAAQSDALASQIAEAILNRGAMA
jgi:F0F1-type ATP synthase membrane subunit b/b'